MKTFEELLALHRLSAERYIKFKIPSAADAEDILQEVCLAAYRHFGELKSQEAFKSWLLTIARNKCNDYFRAKAASMELPLEAITEPALTYSRSGLNLVDIVRDTLEKLGDRDKQILYLYYWRELPQADIAKMLGLPIGTVKSRLHSARRNFKKSYPLTERMESTMKVKTKMPEYMPHYTITPDLRKPFSVKWEELSGWQIIPRLGEKLSWALYDRPTGRRTEWTELEVIGEAEVHGIRGVEIVARQYDSEDYFRTSRIEEIERRFIAQLTDTHCRYLAESHIENGVRKVHTFLDGDEFIQNWGFGEDNCGTETNLAPKGLLKREGNVITGVVAPETLDVTDRCTVTIGGKSYDTVRVMDINCFNDAVASEEFVDTNGRSVLWRRFNRDDWALERFGGTLWSERLPNSEKLIINGEVYVHWYDCITDYIL